ncbi:MAG: hypothetical protein LPK45_12400, partial [Bacteroidota bacterium]|nr:hypothetical protein [Bacteroidota bacterium]MDX5431910.1 hypothetical protein [Bacteroidota bacterium]MDX5470624.1 hypothetical protein [Bacteroidota bacterium]
VKAKQSSGDPNNEMATISARSFTIDETDRYAGSRGDPSRMVSNYAGVQGANDSRNDIVVRGNTPAGVLWRVEGIDIPNPNHFAIPGTSGGPVNIINNKMLANSDFYSGAFPAEFGNAISAVFDLKFRNGNNQKFESSFQFGFLGTELFTEGPINKKKGSSFLIGYRYSSLALFSALNFDIGTNAVPKYQDGGFKLSFPLKNNSSISFWGVGGYSSIDILISEQDPTERNIYGENDRDQYFTSYMGALGSTYSKSFNSSTFFRLTTALTSSSVVAHHDYLFYSPNRDTLYNKEAILQYTFRLSSWNTHAMVNHKFNPKLTLKAGLMVDVQSNYLHDSARAVVQSGNTYSLNNWQVRWNATDNPVLVRPYAQLRYKAGTRITLNGGLYSQYYSRNGKISGLEPRAGAKYALNATSNLSLGIGLHSQIQPIYLYYYQPSLQGPNNPKMDFTKSWHFVLGYDRSIGKGTRLKAETYYQYLYNIPVNDTASSFSLVNTGSGFTRFFPGTLVNDGVARNYGVEITLEHFFSKQFFFLISASLFDAKYQGSDGVWRNTDFNGAYAANFLLTKEFKTGKNSALQIGTKMTTTGGRYYSPADTAASNAISELVGVDTLKNTLQTRPYFRADLRVSYKWNRPKVSHEFALDIVNVLNTKNVLSLTYAPGAAGGDNIRFEYQLGFLPLFYYRLEF